ncbi:ABC transporter substrate-binding protein [Streptomyces sp. NPDC004752]
MNNRIVSRRGVLGGAGALALGGLLAACGESNGKSGGNGSRTVEMVLYNAPLFTSQVSENLGSAFTRKTGITVKAINTGTATYESVDQRVQTDLVAGHIDDIAMVGLNLLGSYITAKRAQPLDDLMRTAGFDKSQLAPTTLALGQDGGHTYALPYAISTVVLYYNADAFKKAGLDPAKPPTTFAEMKSYAQAIVSAKAAKYGVTYSNDNSGNWLFQNFLYSNGGRMMNDDRSRIEFDQEPGVRMLQYWADLFKAGLGQTMTRTQMADAFARGDLAMMLSSSAQAANTAAGAKFEVRSAAMPVPDGGKLRLPAGGAAFVLLSKDSKQLSDAFRAARTMVSPAACTSLVKASGYTPVNTVAASKPQYLGDFFEKNPLYKPGNDQIKNTIPWFGFPGSNATQITKLLDQELVLALRGSKSAADALNEAAKQAQGLLK